MPPFIFRCPNTGFQVQGFAAGDGETEETDDVFVGSLALHADSVHLVNPKTGKTVGENGG